MAEAQERGVNAPARAPRDEAAQTAPDRTISVETSQGLLVVRRVSLGALARIAQRLSARGAGDEAALLDALVREVVGERRRLDGESHEPTHTLAADRCASLDDDDRRSIAAAVLTLEGVKAAGEGLVDDPRDLLVRRYAPMLDTDPIVALSAFASGRVGIGGEASGALLPGQLALFDLTAPIVPRRRAEDPDAASGARSELTARAQRTRLEDTVQRQGALIDRQAREREAAHAEVTQLALRVDDARAETRLYRGLAMAAAGGGLLVALVLAGYAISLRGDLEAQRAAHQAQLGEQQRAFERAAASRTQPPAGATDPVGKRKPRSSGR